MITDTDQCMCPHIRRAHDHYRAGTECAQCDCPRFRRRRWWRRERTTR